MPGDPLDEQFSLPDRRSVGDRLGRMEGMLVALQGLISQSQIQWNTTNHRTDLLEQRLLKLEQTHVTKDDLKELTNKVDQLITSSSTQRGSINAATWTVTNLAPWLAVALALAAWLTPANKALAPTTSPHHQQP